VGLQRRLDVARALLHRPRVLLLDEPTAGMDLASRRVFWHLVLDLRREHGVTVLLATHDLEEAERCDQVAILHRGRVVAAATPAELRRRAGADRAVLSSADDSRAARELQERWGIDARPTSAGLEFEVEDGAWLWVALEQFPVDVRALTWRKPTLADAFLALTGHAITQDAPAAAPSPGPGPGGPRRKGRRR